MKSTFEVLSIFFISILFLFHTTNKKTDKTDEKEELIYNEINSIHMKNIDYKAPIIIVKRD